MIGVESHLSMGELRSIRIFVLGEAFKPGAYTVSSLTTITQALFVSGGVSDIASLRNIQLKRGGKIVTSLDLYDLLNFGDTSNDEILQSGDVVFIPTLQRTVSVSGQVRRPAIYELKGGESVKEVVEMAGGFVSDAYSNLVNVQRIDNGITTQLTFSGDEINRPAQNGDVVDVSGVSDNVSDAVTLVGAFARPGKYQWSQGATLSDFIRNKNTDLLAESDLNYGLVLRNYRTGEDLSIKQFSPIKLIQGETGHDIVLAKDDFVVIFSQDETVNIGNESLESLAKTKDALAKQEKEAWRERIEQRLFWQELGFEIEDPNAIPVRRENNEEDKAPIIKLTELEKESLSRFRDSSAFSRKRLLTPIIEKLKNHASFDDPLRVVEISGSVQYPGLYPLPDGGSINDIFWAAGGLAESAFAFQSELTRYELRQNGEMRVNNISFKPSDIVAGKNDIELMSRDRINVYQNPEWQEELSVVLKGEVAFPGKYTIRRGETLSSVLQRAGGLTPFAEADASIFLRQSLKKQESANLAKLTEELRKEIASEGLRSKSGGGSLVSYSEVQKLLRDLTDVEAIGRLVIDLPSILSGDTQKDFPLEAGDVLAIPGKNKTVNVIGEVYVPTSHLFEENVSYEQYIQLSGGFKTFAATDRTYIVKANGSVVVPNRESNYWFENDSATVTINPGDTIVVPYNSSHIDNLTLWTSASQIAYQLAVTVAALGSL
ncbi:MAG: polysaccharide biosynthesis protein [Alteromonadaceae bacterium]|nr:polysaccharide biosynthesis protein [Alteromonadaceae bacterium]